MRQPELYTAMQIKLWSVWQKSPNSPSIIARPLPWYGLFYKRLKCTWGVFIGRYDALDWEDNKKSKIGNK